jgi:OOP family OmpA-OmpF porin
MMPPFKHKGALMRFLLVMMLIASSAFAADRTGQFGVGGSLGWNSPIFGHPFNDVADSSTNWGLHARYHFNTQWGVELGHSRHEFDDVSSALETTGLTALYRMNGDARLSPLLGAGLAHADFNDTQDWRSVYKFLAGVEYDLIPSLVVSAIADYQYVDGRFFGGGEYATGSNPSHVASGRLALTWYFGCGKNCEKKPAPAEKAAPVAAAPVDGDSDNDGVSDSKDKCPNTAAGVAVNAYGCAKEEKAEIKVNVEFASGKAEVQGLYRAQLQELADFLKSHPNTTAVIEGHTDSSGSAALNKKLSQARAEAVKNYLIKEFSIESRRLSASGFGSEKPIAGNDTLEGRQKNRRVMAVVSE